MPFQDPPDILDEAWSPDQGLPPLMMNDRVPATAQAPATLPPPTAEQQDALLRTDRQPTGSSGPQVRHGVSTQPGGLSWAVGSDAFAPAGYKPNESRSTGVGKYGGSPLYAPVIGYPDAVIANRLDRISKERKQVQDAMAKFNPAAGVEDVNAPEYRDDYQRGVMSDLHGYQAQVQQLYGDEEGLKRLMDPNTKEGQGLRERVSQWTTIARLTNQATKSADAVIEGMDSGALEYNQYLYDLATQERHKLGVQAGNHDPKALANSLKVFTGTASLDDQVKKDGIGELLKSAGTTEQFAEQVRANSKDPHYRAGFASILTKKTVDREDVIEALTDRYYPSYRNYMSRDQMKNYFTSIAGSLSEEKLTQSQIHVPKGDGPTNAAANYNVEQTELPTGLSDAFGNNAKGITGTWPTISLYGSTNKQAKLANPLSFRHGDRESYMYPERVMRVGDRNVIIGKEVGMPRTVAEKAAAAKNTGFSLADIDAASAAVDKDPTSEEAQAAIQKFGILQPRIVPFDSNESLIRGMGYDPDKVAGELIKSKPRGYAGTRREQPAFVDKPRGIPDFVVSAGYSKADWDGLTDKQRAAILKAGKL